MSDWTCDANEALTLSLVRAQKDREALSREESFEGFNPMFTYPIFGENEKIYGYKDLLIDLRFASGSLQQYLSVSYAEKLPSTSTVDDVEGILQKFIPPGYSTDEESFLKRVEDDASSFRPPGQLIYSYTRLTPNTASKGKRKRSGTDRDLDPANDEVAEFEVYHATWNTPDFREYHRRMQLFILLYIEAGSYINEEEDTWEFTLLYEKRKRRDGSHTVAYHFVGYSSLYPFYHFPEKVRMRLSQFVILTPYQRQAHGSELYKAIYHYVCKSPNIAELTVEDPAEAFEDLRDKNDLRLLLSNELFLSDAFGSSILLEHDFGTGRARKSGRAASEADVSSRDHETRGSPPEKTSPLESETLRSGRLGPPVDRRWAEKWRKELKIAGRQFHRLIEMLILLRLDPTDVVKARAYRLQVKERLYRFNFEILAQLEPDERYEKLEETYQNVVEDYHRILAFVT